VNTKTGISTLNWDKKNRWFLLLFAVFESANNKGHLYLLLWNKILSKSSRNTNAISSDRGAGCMKTLCGPHLARRPLVWDSCSSLWLNTYVGTIFEHELGGIHIRTRYTHGLIWSAGQLCNEISKFNLRVVSKWRHSFDNEATNPVIISIKDCLICCFVQCPPLNRITLAQHKSDNNNRWWSKSCGLAVEHSARDQKVVGLIPVEC